MEIVQLLLVCDRTLTLNINKTETIHLTCTLQLRSQLRNHHIVLAISHFLRHTYNGICKQGFAYQATCKIKVRIAIRIGEESIVIDNAKVREPFLCLVTIWIFNQKIRYDPIRMTSRSCFMQLSETIGSDVIITIKIKNKLALGNRQTCFACLRYSRIPLMDRHYANIATCPGINDSRTTILGTIIYQNNLNILQCLLNNTLYRLVKIILNIVYRNNNCNFRHWNHVLV